jgi:hypothetical protein
MKKKDADPVVLFSVLERKNDLADRPDITAP